MAHSVQFDGETIEQLTEDEMAEAVVVITQLSNLSFMIKNDYLSRRAFMDFGPCDSRDCIQP